MFGTDEVLVAVKQWIAVDGIAIAIAVQAVTCFHVMSDRHKDFRARYADAESLIAQALAAVVNAAKAELFAIFSGSVRRRTGQRGFRPRGRAGTAVARISGAARGRAGAVDRPQLTGRGAQRTAPRHFAGYSAASA